MVFPTYPAEPFFIFFFVFDFVFDVIVVAVLPAVHVSSKSIKSRRTAADSLDYTTMKPPLFFAHAPMPATCSRQSQLSVPYVYSL